MQKNYLTEIVIIRFILILLLVFYHAFAIYSGAWHPIEGFPDVPVYWWLDKISYAFMLETFVFISGYVFGYQVRTKGESKLNAKSLFIGKFKRLIIPSMVFSLLYIMLLGNITQPVGKTLYDMVNGYAHLWFLPMLFWCFVAVWIIEKFHVKPTIVIPLLLICSIFSFVPLPIRMDKTLYYMVFFYVGYLLKRSDYNLGRFYASRFACVLIASFIAIFTLLTLYVNNICEIILFGNNLLITKIIHLSLNNLSKLVYSSVGLAMLLVVVGILEQARIKPFPQWLIKVGALCMGVYLFQQFILKGLYDHTDMPTILGPYWLPWVGFVIALIASLLISYLLRHLSIGRFLIG